MRVRWSPRALIAAALIVGLWTMIGLLLNRSRPGAGVLTLDAAIACTLAGALLFAAPFALGHRLLNRRRIGSNPAYALLGALAAVPVYLAIQDWDVLARSAADGTISMTLIRPLVVGALVGFIYRRSAGADIVGDDPDQLAVFARDPSSPETLVSTLEAEYYSGPLQVRLSFGAICVGALCGGLAQLVAFIAGAALRVHSQVDLSRFDGATAQTIVGLLFFGLPSMLIVGSGALLLQRLGWTRRLHAAAVGLTLPTAGGVLIGLVVRHPVAVEMGFALALPSALAMLAYRRLAGLEPKALPEDIEVTDRRTLIGADHVRRRVHRVVGPRV